MCRLQELVMCRHIHMEMVDVMRLAKGTGYHESRAYGGHVLQICPHSGRDYSMHRVNWALHPDPHSRGHDLSGESTILYAWARSVYPPQWFLPTAQVKAALLCHSRISLGAISATPA